MPVRSPERYSRSRRLAMTPSSAAPALLSQAFVSLNLVVAGDSRMRVLSLKYREAKASSRRTSFGQRQLRQCARILIGQQIKDDKQRGGFLRQPLDPAGRWMDALKQCIERERPVLRDHDLAVDNKPLGFHRT